MVGEKHISRGEGGLTLVGGVDLGGSGLRVVVDEGFGTTEGTGVGVGPVQRPPIHVMMYVCLLSRLLFAGACF